MRKIIYENPSTGESITFADDSGYGLITLTGTGIPDIENTEQRAPSQDGTTWIETLLEPREIKAEFICYNATPTTAYETMRYVNRVLNCKTEPGKITYTNDYGTWVIYGTPDVKFKEYKVSENSGRPVGKVEFYCYDPYWQDEEDTVVMMSNLSDAQEVTITGDVPSTITAVIKGSSTGPTLTEAVQGVKLDYNATSDKQLTITTGYGNKKVLEQNESIWSIREHGVGVTNIIVVSGVYWGTVGSSVVSSVDGNDWVVRISYKGYTLSNIQHDGEKFYIYITTGSSYYALASSVNGVDWEHLYLGRIYNYSGGYVEKFFIIDGYFILFCRYAATEVAFKKSSDKGLTYTNIFTSLTYYTTRLGGWLKVGSSYLFSIYYISGGYSIYVSDDLLTATTVISSTSGLESKFAVLGSVVVSGNYYSTDGGITFSDYSGTNYYFPESDGDVIFAHTGALDEIVYTTDGTTWTSVDTLDGITDIKFNSVINRVIATTPSGGAYIVTTDVVTPIKVGMPVKTITKTKVMDGSFYLYGGTVSPSIGITLDFSSITERDSNIISPYDIAFLNSWFYLTYSGKLVKTQDFVSYTDAYSYGSSVFAVSLSESSTELFLCLRNANYTPNRYYFNTSSDGSSFVNKLTVLDIENSTTMVAIKTASRYLVCIYKRLYSSTDGVSWSYIDTDIKSGMFYKTGTTVYLYGDSKTVYVSTDDGASFTEKNININVSSIKSMTQDDDYVYAVFPKTEAVSSNFTITNSQIYRAKHDMLYWERYDDGAIFPLNGIFYEEGLYGLYGDNGSIFATDGDNTPVNKIQNLTADSKFFSLQPGQNILKLDVDTGLAIANIRYRNRFTGVGC